MKRRKKTKKQLKRNVVQEAERWEGKRRDNEAFQTERGTRGGVEGTKQLKRASDRRGRVKGREETTSGPTKRVEGKIDEVGKSADNAMYSGI